MPYNLLSYCLQKRLRGVGNVVRCPPTITISHKSQTKNNVLILTKSQKVAHKRKHDAELFLELIRTIHFRYRLP